MYHIGFSGSRDGMTPQQQAYLEQRLWAIAAGQGPVNIVDFHHGMSGESDKIAHYIARKYKYYIIGHPCIEPELQKYRFDCVCDEVRNMAPALERNGHIVGEIGSVTGLLITTPKTDTWSRSGTWGAMQRAKSAGVRVEHIQRNGKMVEF